MAQSAVTVRIDSEMKSQFDELCEQFGMSESNLEDQFVEQFGEMHTAITKKFKIDQVHYGMEL
jgi:antitoxin component of RelBE/YafQ-DinJ toxin-antitoxin module